MTTQQDCQEYQRISPCPKTCLMAHVLGHGCLFLGAAVAPYEPFAYSHLDSAIFPLSLNVLGIGFEQNNRKQDTTFLLVSSAISCSPPYC